MSVDDSRTSMLPIAPTRTDQPTAVYFRGSDVIKLKRKRIDVKTATQRLLLRGNAAAKYKLLVGQSPRHPSPLR